MDDCDYDFIYGVVDELWKTVSRTISQNASDVNEISFVTRCNLKAVFRLLKVPPII